MMRKFISQLGFLLLLCGVVYSCSTLPRSVRKANKRVSMAQTAKKQIAKSRLNVDSTGHGSNVRAIMKDSVKQFITDVEIDETGSAISVVNIEEIIVTSTLKTLPERFGYIVVDFAVTVPKELMHQKWSIILTPVLNREDSVIRLEKVVINGGKAREYQQKCYWKYDKSLNLYTRILTGRKTLIEDEYRHYQGRDSIRNAKVDAVKARQIERYSHSAKNPYDVKRSERFPNGGYATKPSVEGRLSNSFKSEVNNSIYNQRTELFNAKFKAQVAKSKSRRASNLEAQAMKHRYNDRLEYLDRVMTRKDSFNVRQAYVSRPSDETIERDGRKIATRHLKNPRVANARVDSVTMAKNGDFRYHYTQEIKTDENLNRFSLTMDGVMQNRKATERVDMSVGDTMRYTVTSMLGMIDTATRYVYNVVSKYATVNERNWITYPLGKFNIIDTLANNRAELDKVKKLMHSLLFQYEFFIDSIVITAASSPEGSLVRNEKLAQQRANSLRSYLMKEFDANIDTLINIRWIAEDWNTLRVLIAKDTAVHNRQDILKLIHETGNKDACEALIKKRFPDDYKYISKELYPMLRSVNFKYDLRRVGMVQDTVYTTEIDTAYHRGVDLLAKRKYREALGVLNDYKDINTAITLMSLGYDKAALEIMYATPETPNRDYMMAIVLYRQKRYEEAYNHYTSACKGDSALKHRGNLDPEIQGLLKIYKKDNDEEDF